MGSPDQSRLAEAKEAAQHENFVADFAIFHAYAGYVDYDFENDGGLVFKPMGWMILRRSSRVCGGYLGPYQGLREGRPFPA